MTEEAIVHSIRDSLLDTGERMFAKAGYDGVSMRELTSSAGINLAAVNYHFGTKERLFEAVILRRLRPINEQRVAALNQVLAEAGDGRPTLGAVLEAFARPFIMGMRSDEQASLRRMMVRLFMEADPLVKPIFERELLPIARQFRSAMARACPQMQQHQIDMGLVFYVGAMINFLTSEKRRSLKLICDTDFLSDEETLRHLIAFGVAGFAGLATMVDQSAKSDFENR